MIELSKYYQVIGAKEEFRDDNPIPIRSLIFKDLRNAFSIYPEQQIYFSEDRTTLIHDGALYDWYGREVELGKGIKRIIHPFGCHFSTGIYETFVVQREDERLAIATLSKHPNLHNDCSPALQVKNSLLGNIVLNGQIVNLHYQWSFKRELDPQDYSCLKYFRYDSDYRILTGVQNDTSLSDKNKIFFYPTKERYFNPILHWIAKDRASILDYPTERINDDRQIVKIKDILRTNYLFGPFMYSSPSGDKISAFFIQQKDYGVEYTRVSTDTEVLRHADNSQSLIWYYDPA